MYAYGRGAVVKVPKPATPGSWIEAEAEYVEAVRAVGAPAPSLLGIERIGGRPASVWERVDGPSMWQQVVERPARSAGLGRTLAEVQLALFELVPPVTLPDQRDRLISKIRWSAANVDPAFAEALGLLPERTGTPRLCHGDLHPSNVIMSERGVVIVDWFDASRGDRMADVARSLLTLLGRRGHAPEPSAGGQIGRPSQCSPGHTSLASRTRSRSRPNCSHAGRQSMLWPVWPRGAPDPSLCCACVREAQAAAG